MRKASRLLIRLAGGLLLLLAIAALVALWIARGSLAPDQREMLRTAFGLLDPLPLTPSWRSVMNGSTLTTFPVSALVRSSGLNLPRPPAPTTVLALSAAMKSASEASEVPPGLNPRNITSSCLNVVGLSTTFTPFDSSHSVMPMPARVAVRTIFPGVGAVSINVEDVTVST